MKERPILFSGQMVRAILEGRKTMTRRIVKPQPVNEWNWHPKPGESICGNKRMWLRLCPYGQPGDRLWVRETWAAPHAYDHLLPRMFPREARIHYAATEERGGLLWRSSIHMPRWTSRITLEIVDIRVERLLDISEEDARLEGIDLGGFQSMTEGIAGREHRIKFRELWETINGPGSWDANPWVWVVEFKRIEQAGKAEGSEK